MYHAKIGHVHLKVHSLAQSVDFYSKILNMRVTETVENQFAFLSGSALHHEVALQQVGETAPRPSRFSTGLYHTAFEVPDKFDLAQAWQKLRSERIAFVAVDHGISWALYFADPDGNGLEIYVDTRRDPAGRQVWNGYSRPLSDEEIAHGLAGSQ